MLAVKWAYFLITSGSVGRAVLGRVGGGRSLAGGQGSAWEADMENEFGSRSRTVILHR